ncbi:MAG: sialidase [Acidobacteria bacterium]|nr:MAG: sialidase [Acidobacteriota bacterium]
MAWCAVLGLPAALAAAQEPEPPVEIPAELFAELTYRHVGPVGNRVPAVVGEAGNPLVYYAGTASGGIFKSEDGGVSWRPIFDEQPAASIGALAVAPSDPNVVWAGTGETFIRSNVSIGNGVYRSTDRGKTWQHRGLEKSGRIGRIVVHPDDPDVAYAAALGHCYGPQEERGLYRTRDGGETWERVLFAGPDAGAIDVVMDPSNPRILFAATWQFVMSTSGRTSGGPASGLFTSRDGGDSWTRLEGNGLPEPPWGKIGLAMTAADPERIYALIETSSNRDFADSDPFQGVLWRSDDGGESWSMISADNTLVQRPLYYTRAAVAPDDADEIHFMAVEHSLSKDGGRSIESVGSGWDHHDMWIDPLIPDRMIVGHDGGVSISTNRGKTWMRPLLPNAQMYHVATDREVPYNLYGNRQDGPSTYGPSNSLSGDGIPIGAWRSVGGCEVGFAIPSPADPNLVWSGCYDGILELHDRRTGHSRNVSVWPAAIESWPAEDLRYRFQWTFPIAISPHDPNRVWVGSQYVHQTTDGGQSWRIISPDLTTADPRLMRRSGGLTLDDAGPTIAPVVFAIAGSPLEPGVIWAGTNDGQVQLTRDGGETWTNVTGNLPGLPPLGTVSNLEPSRHAPGRVYLTVDRHQEGDPTTYVYKTEDYGRSWRSIAGDVPQSVFAYAHCVREDPVRPGLLYLGTENALYVSFDDGARWHPLNAGLPPAPVHWLEIQDRFNDLVVATYGRGFWILDDVTPLQQLTAAHLAAAAALLPPRPAYRLRSIEPPFEQPNDPAAGTNPTYGASLHYWLRDEAEDVEVAILDGDGEVVATLEDVPGDPGLHRVYWDLRYERTPEVKLFTPPEENPHVAVPEEGRPLSDGGRFALLAPPGAYAVRLRAGEASFEQPLEVRKDPRSAAGDDDLAAQMAVLFELRETIVDAARLIDHVERLRAQIDDLEGRLEGREDAVEIRQAAADLDRDLRRLEGHFFDLRLTGARQDTLRWKRLLYARLTYLARSIGQSDFRPTDPQLELSRELRQEVERHLERLTALNERVGAFNEDLRAAGLDGLILPAQAP